MAIAPSRIAAASPRQPAQADALMAGNLPGSMVARLAADAERFSAFWEARRERAPGLRDQLARQKAPERPPFSPSALVDPFGDPI